MIRYYENLVGTGADRTVMCNTSDAKLYLKYGKGRGAIVFMRGRDRDLNDHDIVIAPNDKHQLFDGYVGWISYWWWPDELR